MTQWRAFLYATICLSLIPLVYFQLPASFYTLSTILSLLAVLLSIKGMRTGHQ